MVKTVNRTFTVKTGIQLVPDYENRTFEEKDFTIFDNDTVPPNVQVDSVTVIRASMPVDKFFELADKKIIEVKQGIEV